jgi:nucleoside-diphosphate-sugar epimerase
MRIVVTGGSGKAGRWAVRRLREAGYDVLNVDWTHDGSAHGMCLVTDLTVPGQCFEALTGADAVVHLAAIPAPEVRPPAETFRINMLSTYNVFAAAEAHRLRRVVYASSETVLGLPFDEPPAFAPIDETHPPRPESSYSLAKLAGETIAEQFARRTGVAHIGLRISNIMEPADYQAFPGFWHDATLRRWNLWGYVDARDVALACELSLTAEVSGSAVVIIAASDTVMTRDSADLMAEVYPTVPLSRALAGRETLLSIESARETLGYEPRFTWSDEIAGPADP